MFEFEETAVSLETLQRQRTVISLEANGISQTLSAVTSRLPVFVNDIKTFITKNLNPFAVNINLVDSRSLEVRFRSLDYTSAAHLGVFTPAGFKGTWLEYSQLLHRSQKVLDDLQEGLLKPFELYLAQLLTSPDHLRDNSLSPKLARYKSPDVDQLKKDFAQFIGNGTSTESTYGDVVKRHADLPFVTRDVNEVNTRFARIDRSVLLKQVSSISDLIERLIENIKNHPDEYIVSGVTLKALTDLTFFMAREIEYYTVHGYYLDSFTLSVKDSYKRLEKATA